MMTDNEQIVDCKISAIAIAIKLLVALQEKHVPIVSFTSDHVRPMTNNPAVRVEVLYGQDEQSDTYKDTREAVVTIVPFPYWHVFEEGSHLVIEIDYPLQDCLGCPIYDSCRL
jgi:hypothetical protein